MNNANEPERCVLIIPVTFQKQASSCDFRRALFAVNATVK